MHETDHTPETAAGGDRSRRASRQEQRTRQIWQRLMALILLVPGLFSLLTCYISLREGEWKAALVFTATSVLFGLAGTMVWLQVRPSTLKQLLRKVMK